MGIPIPDGDPDKLGIAEGIWRGLAESGTAAVGAYRAGRFVEKINHYAGLIRGVVAVAKLRIAVTVRKAVGGTRQAVKRIADLLPLRTKVVNGRWFSRPGNRTNQEVLDSGQHLPLTEESVREYARRAGVDSDGVEINIATSPDDVRYYDAMEASASTHENSINLGPSAFADEESLVRNLIHERVHVEQYRDGRVGQMESLRDLEDEPYAADAAGWESYRKNGGR
ncbi:DUF4157 domain-containing protein [Nocardia sp. NPDC057353]|uniref:eCIS core domain-containing protein n=1 Tax=Nocardia sp. NPDC057353 TaxID=3346104 RepID=UPI003643CBCB